MASELAILTEPNQEATLRDCVRALRRTASYRLPPALDERLLRLSENKESLSELERAELLEMVEFADQRTLDKAQAQALLKRLGEAFPQLQSSASWHQYPAD